MYMLQKETGWTDEYILWGAAWATFQLKQMDAPRYKFSKSDTIVDEDELKEFLNEVNK